MANASGTAVAEALTADPFTSLAVHYGMLLGVPDFQVMLANPRGKLRLHQAWQHGPGVVWGFEVSIPDASSELRVSPGLAIDGVGREVSLAAEYCLDVAQWLDQHEDAAVDVTADATTFNARLVLTHSSCLSRPVPAIASTCDGSTNDTAWSRVLETGALELRPYGNDQAGNPAAPADDRNGAFARLRALVRDGTLALDDGSPAPAGWLDALRLAAALETRDLAPPAFSGGSATSTRLFPVDPPGEIVLADLPGLRIEKSGDARLLVAPTIDIAVRRSHVSTWLLEELLGELLHHLHGSLAGAGGPAVTNVSRSATTVTVELSDALVESTIVPAMALHRMDTAAADPAWDPIDLAAAGVVTYTPPDPGPPTPAAITIGLPEEPTATRFFRLVLIGTGATPMVGLVDGRPVPIASGRDVVPTIT